MDKLSDIKKDFSQWYQDVLIQSEFIDSSPVKGCFVLRPYCYALWENIKTVLDYEISKTGAQNAYFPLFIPESFLKKEAKHVEGFAPELAVVTHAGGKKLEEPLVIRPTSETIVYAMFAKWIKSWRDLPLKINQWANVVRWELRTRPFLRTVEFLWQEGHTAFAKEDEAINNAEQMLKIYKDFIQDYLAIPVITGLKTDTEKFAGAQKTYCLESMMQDGKALQMGTTHVLLKSFSESFGIKFQAEDGSMQSPRCSSWGLTTRLIGAVVMVHGDQKGLVMPPKIAPIKAVIIPIYRKEEEKDVVLNKARELKDKLCKKDFIVTIDENDKKTPGSKFYEWELKGVPVRIEIGPKDIEKKQVVLVDRTEIDRAKRKSFVSIDNVDVSLNNLLDNIQKDLFKKAEDKLKNHWHKEEKLKTFGPALEKNNGFYQSGWCGNTRCESKLKEFKGTIRCVLDKKDFDSCFSCGEISKTDVLIAKSY